MKKKDIIFLSIGVIMFGVIVFLVTYIVMSHKKGTSDVMDTTTNISETSDSTEAIDETEISDAATTLQLIDSEVVSTTTVAATTTVQQQQMTTAISGSSPKISKAVIIGEYNNLGDGYMYRIDVMGDYDYWVAAIDYKWATGGKDHETISSRDLTKEYPYITGGSEGVDISAVLTPYDKNGKAGSAYKVKYEGVTEYKEAKTTTTPTTTAPPKTGSIKYYGTDELNKYPEYSNALIACFSSDFSVFCDIPDYILNAGEVYYALIDINSDISR